MNRLLVVIWILFGFSLADTACKPGNPSATCPGAGAFVKLVTNAKGQVYYDSSQSSYFIRVANSFDSYDIGYTCNLPSDYSKGGLNVQFSGSYYEYNKQVYGLVGNKYYYLSIDTIF